MQLRNHKTKEIRNALYEQKRNDLKSKKSNEKLETVFLLGSLVWGKLSGSPWWPGIVVDSSMCGMDKCSSSDRWILWFGESTVSKLPTKSLLDFSQNFQNKFGNENHVRFISAVIEACQEYAKKNHYMIEDWSSEEIISWSKNNFLPIPFVDEDAIFSTYQKFSPIVTQRLANIAGINKRLRERQESMKLKMQLSGRKRKIGEFQKIMCRPALNQEILKRVARNEVDIQDICLGCTVTKKQEHNIQDHPLFKGGMCCACMERFKETFMIMNDGLHVYCCICGYNFKKMILCSGATCRRIYCMQCIDIFSFQRIPKELSYICFHCDGSIQDTLIRRNNTWRRNLFKLYHHSDEHTEILSRSLAFPKRDMSVLSLHDITGKVLQILVNLGIDIQTYYYTQADIEVLGEDTKWKNYATDLGHKDRILRDKWTDIGNIDLLISYIPFNIQPKYPEIEEDISNEEIASELFFDFYYMLQDIQQKISDENNHHMFWAFGVEIETSINFQDVVNRFLQKYPVFQDCVNSNSNLFWTNIPQPRNNIPSIDLILQPLCCFFS